MRKTKIVCTLGPASNTAETIRDMFRAGMNVARFNLSHGSHESHSELIGLFRKVRDELSIPAAVMLDTKGPEIRLGKFEGGEAMLETGKFITLTTEEILGTSEKCFINYQDLPAQLPPDTKILLDDGAIVLRSDSIDGNEIKCKIEFGGIIKNNKGVNIPGISLSMPYLSEADKSDLLFAIEQEVEFVAASFVRKKQDVSDLRKFLDYHGGHSIKIISKIENLEGIENFDEILEKSNGIMVARGDMGVEVEYERLPGIQKRIIKSSYRAGKMVITATQMLESMIHNPTPTRAEITDVANAVFDGTSAVMLSGESAAGKYPVRAVKVMSKIAEQAEVDIFDLDLLLERLFETSTANMSLAMCDAACLTAKDADAKAIIVVTKSGSTARGISKFRPETPIVAATPVITTFHQLALSWGVYPVVAKIIKSSDDLFIHAIDCAKQIDIVEDGDRVVIIGNVPIGRKGATNTLKLETVGSKQ